MVEAVLSSAARARFDPERLTRHVFTSSSCGLCGKATLEALFTDRAPLPAGDHPGGGV